MTNVKNNMLKRGSCVLLMLAMLLAFLPVDAFATTGGASTLNVTVAEPGFGDISVLPLQVSNADGYVANITGISVNGTAWSPNDYKAALNGKQYYLDTDNNKIYLNHDGTTELIAGDSVVITNPTNGDLRLTLTSENGKFGVEVNNSVYVLMNIPYDEFYGVTAADSTSVDYDAITSATNKTGNYGKTGGAYHSGTTAKVEGDTVTAVGGANGAEMQGVIWAVKVSNAADLETLGGTEIKNDDTVTVATLGRGQTTYTNLVSYETLMEAEPYSYYVLDSAPDYYMELTVENGQATFSNESGTATEKDQITPDVSYGTNWGDVQLKVDGATDTSDKLINAVVITAKDSDNNETQVGLAHLTNVWAYNEIAWKAAQIPGLDGKTITNIRYYCSAKDSDNTDSTAPDYENYVYDYPVQIAIPSVYDGEVTASFTDSNTIALEGLPEGAEVQAKVYTGSRNNYTYLTPLVVDPADQDIDPTTVAVEDNKISIESGSVTNDNGETKTYGNTMLGTTYTIEFSCDDYIINKITVTYSPYVLMNIPYAEFYEGEGVEYADDVDAITAATSNKATNKDLAANSYYDGSAEKIEILGVSYPIKVSTITDSEKYTEVEDSVALRSAGNYAYVVLDETPDSYKELTESNGAVSFGKATGTAEAKEANVTLSTGGDGRHAFYYELAVSGLDGVATGATNVCAVTVTTNDNEVYGLRHVTEIWRATELGFEAGHELEGKTVTSITYYLNDGSIYKISVSDMYIPFNTKSTALEVADAKNNTGATTGTIADLPDDFNATYAVTKNGEDTNITTSVNGGNITLTWTGTPEQGAYTLTATDSDGKYAPVTATFVLSTDKVYAKYNNSVKKLVAANDVTDEEFSAYLSAITSVTVDGTSYSASGRNAVTIINTDGSLNMENGKVDFSEGTHEVTVKATGYPYLTFTVKQSSGGVVVGPTTPTNPSKPTEPDEPTEPDTPDEPTTSRFIDVANDAWYAEAVNTVADKGLMVGVSANQFAPNATLTRAELAQILYNKAGKPAVSSLSTFTDVPATAWYAKAVAWAQQNNVVSGIGGNKFAPNQIITREQIAVMLYNEAGKPTVNGTITGFADAASVSAWAKDAVLWATQNNVINGAVQSDGTLRINPASGATRAETAALLVNYYYK